MGYYDDMTVITYSFPEHDFGAGAGAHAIKPPRGFNMGRLLDIGVNVTETFTDDTLPAYVRVGTATDADAYAQLGMAEAAATDFWNTQDDTDAIIEADIPAATQLEVAFTQPTGGTPAGKGYVHIVIGWY